MTNAEKYLKDGVDIKQMATEMVDYFNFPPYEGIGEGSIEAFFDKEAKPTLTEDERVILRNLKSIHNVIGRNRDGNIQLMCKEPRVKDCIWHINLSCYNHLFQFIKERRRIQDKGVVRK